jgi:hypothetical protein
MTPYPADFGAYVLAALPYAGMEALRIAGWCTAVVAPAAAGVWLLARAHRMARRVGGLMDAGDGQGGIPGRGHLRKVTGDVDREHLPVTRAMSLAELDAIHGPHLGDLTGPDHVVTGQLAAAQDALTPRMVAPTRADLASARQSCHRCRTGSTAFRCTCETDCFEVHCHGGLT